MKNVSEDVPDEKIEETQEDAEAYQRPSEEEETEAEEDKPEDSEEKAETEVLETVMAEAVVEEPVDHGDYEPGTKVSHAIFGVGEVKDSKPKGENYRLDIDFEDGTSKTLLSTFIEIVNDDSTEEEDDEVNDGDGEIVEAEAEAVVAEPVEEAVEDEAVLDTDVVYSRPKEKDDPETIIDLSKPEVQDAEIVDEDD